MKQLNNKNVVFFGASRFVLPIIELLNRDYNLKLVVTTEKNLSDAVPKYCRQHAIPYVSASTLSELKAIRDTLSAINAPVAVLAYFGLIIPQSFLEMFPKGIVNIHPSRLPLYRGPTPGQTALILGDVRTGVSVMLLDKEVDHGPVLAQEEEEILAADTAATLYERLFTKGVALLEAVLPAYIAGELKPVEQDHAKATYTKPLTRQSGFLDTAKSIAPELLDRMIRAFDPWPGVWTKWQTNDKEKIIKFLPGKRIQVEGKKLMSYKDFMNGYPEGKKFLEKLGLL